MLSHDYLVLLFIVFFLEDGLKGDDSSKMGATSSPNAARLASLQERRKALEETINKRNTELKQLCIQVCLHFH